MTRRQIELAIAKTAGYENDNRTLTRLVVERRGASYQALLKAWAVGRDAWQADRKAPKPIYTADDLASFYACHPAD